MAASEPSPPVRPPAIARGLGLWLFRARWLMAPFYVGLVVALAAVLVVFLKEAWHALAQLAEMTPEQAIMMALSLIDLSLVGNLLLIVIFSGYENFVSKIDTAGHVDRPTWMGTVDFSGMKVKLIGSIVAISAISLLRAFMRLSGETATPAEQAASGHHAVAPPDQDTLRWLLILHVTFVLSGVLFAIMDYISEKAHTLGGHGVKVEAPDGGA